MLTRQFSQSFSRLVGVATVLLLSLTSVGCAHVEKRQETSSGISFEVISSEDFSIHYAVSGDSQQSGILFIHGAPGSWSAFREYLADSELQKYFFMISIDRLNWGQSSQHANFSFTRQSKAIARVMQKFPTKKWLIIGHSLGASIAPTLYLDYPNTIFGMILLAGTLSPELGVPRWYNKLADTKFLSLLLPDNLSKANNEIMALQYELARVNERILKTYIEIPVIVMQGMKDRLVSPKNIQFISDHWKNHFNKLRVISIEKEGHFLPWRRQQLIYQQIMQINLAMP